MIMDDYVISFNDEIGAIYKSSTSKLLKITPSIASTLKKEKDTGNISDNTIKFLKKNFNEIKTNNTNPLEGFIKNRKLYRLQLVVTNSCNLNCRYCYANGGTYNLNINNMSIKIADKIIDTLSLYVDEIEVIQFFGGEPLQAYKVIMYICDKLREKINKLGKITMTSNFTTLPIEFIEYIKKYNISITVSIDGPKEINDKLRRYKNNNISIFDKISNNIKLLRSYGGDINAIECTFTDEHRSLGFTKKFLNDYFINTFNINNIIIADEEKYEETSKSKIKLLDFEDIINDFRNNKNISVTKINILSKLLKKNNSERFCNVGFSSISFSPKGDIYPCHKFLLTKEYCMGNICDSNVFSSKLFDRVGKSLNLLNFENDKCNSCVAKNICFRCPASLALNNSIDIDDTMCAEYIKFMEIIILEVIKFYESPNWNNIMISSKQNLR